jgi:hypothetical protein
MEGRHLRLVAKGSSGPQPVLLLCPLSLPTWLNGQLLWLFLELAPGPGHLHSPEMGPLLQAKPASDPSALLRPQ